MSISHIFLKYHKSFLRPNPLISGFWALLITRDQKVWQILFRPLFKVATVILLGCYDNCMIFWCSSSLYFWKKQKLVYQCKCLPCGKWIKKPMVLHYSGSEDFRTWQCQSKREIPFTDDGNSSYCVRHNTF